MYFALAWSFMTSSKWSHDFWPPIRKLEFHRSVNLRCFSLQILAHSVEVKKLWMKSEEEDIRKISDKKCFSDLCCNRCCCQNAHLYLELSPVTKYWALKYRAQNYRALKYRALKYRAQKYWALKYRALNCRALKYRSLKLDHPKNINLLKILRRYPNVFPVQRNQRSS